MGHGIDLRHLRCLVVATETLNYTRAAERLGVTQPSVTATLRELEQRLGVAVMGRLGVGLRVTHAGKEFARCARAVTVATDELMLRARTASGVLSPTLDIGFWPAAAVELTGAITERFVDAMPGVALRWQECLRDPSAGLDDGSVSVAFVRLPFESSELEHRVLCSEPRAVALPAGHRLADRESVTFDEIADEPIVGYECDDEIFQRFWLALDHRRERPEIVARARTLAEHLEAVSMGAAIALTVMSAERYYPRPGISYVRVTDLPPSRIAVAWHPSNEGPLVRSFVENAVGACEDDPDLVRTIAAPHDLRTAPDVLRARRAASGVRRSGSLPPDAAVELRHLRVFVAVAEEASFARAAEEMYLSPSSLTKQVRQLEERVGTSLLERSSRRVSLTPAGRDFLAATRPVLARLDRGVEQARAVGRGERGTLRLGFHVGAALELTAPIMQAFRERRPDVEVSLSEIGWVDTSAGTREGITDVGIVRMPVDLTDLEHVMLFDEPCVVGVHVSHPLADRDEVRFAEVADDPVPVMQSNDTGWRDWWAMVHMRDGKPVPVAAHTSTYHENLEVVTNAAGVVFAPAAIARYFPRPDVRYLRVSDAPFCGVAIVWRGDADEAVTAAFVDIAVSVATSRPDLVGAIEAGATVS
jgi:DNA-binding transcriptional LysR family regulator